MQNDLIRSYEQNQHFDHDDLRQGVTHSVRVCHTLTKTITVETLVLWLTIRNYCSGYHLLLFLDIAVSVGGVGGVGGDGS